MNTSPQVTSARAQALLRLPEVIARTGLSKSAIYARLQQDPPAFPKPIKLGPRISAWPSDEIDAFIAGAIRACREGVTE